MKILITGGAGYVGYSLIHKIIADYPNAGITVYDNLSRKNYALFISKKLKKEKITFIQGEILDSRKLKKSLIGHDTVIHLAAKVTTPYADNDAHIFEQVNHWGTAELAMAIEDNENIKRVIYLSSLSVYGTHEEEISTNTDLKPRSFYGISKLKGEEQLARLQSSKEIIILRSGNVYGLNPAIRLDAVVNKFMFDAHFNNRISIHGSGEQHRAFIHVEKLSLVISKLLNEKSALPIYNLAEYNLSIMEIVSAVRNLYPELEYIPVNQNIRMRDVIVELKNQPLLQLLKDSKDFETELTDFKNSFSF
jgi:UDP-glucose 4-epimerase